MAGKRSTTENPAERESEAVGGPAAGEVEDDELLESATPRLDTSGKAPAFVQYIGTSDVREIDARAWANVDINDQKKVVWDKRRFRGDRVPIGDLSPAAVEYCIQFDGGFRLLDEDGKAV